MHFRHREIHNDEKSSIRCIHFFCKQEWSFSIDLWSRTFYGVFNVHRWARFCSIWFIFGHHPANFIWTIASWKWVREGRTKIKSYFSILTIVENSVHAKIWVTVCVHICFGIFGKFGMGKVLWIRKVSYSLNWMPASKTQHHAASSGWYGCRQSWAIKQTFKCIFNTFSLCSFAFQSTSPTILSPCHSSNPHNILF